MLELHKNTTQDKVVIEDNDFILIMIDRHEKSEIKYYMNYGDCVSEKFYEATLNSEHPLLFILNKKSDEFSLLFLINKEIIWFFKTLCWGYPKPYVYEKVIEIFPTLPQYVVEEFIKGRIDNFFNMDYLLSRLGEFIFVSIQTMGIQFIIDSLPKNIREIILDMSYYGNFDNLNTFECSLKNLENLKFVYYSKNVYIHGEDELVCKGVIVRPIYGTAQTY